MTATLEMESYLQDPSVQKSIVGMCQQDAEGEKLMEPSTIAPSVIRQCADRLDRVEKAQHVAGAIGLRRWEKRTTTDESLPV